MNDSNVVVAPQNFFEKEVVNLQQLKVENFDSLVVAAVAVNKEKKKTTKKNLNLPREYEEYKNSADKCSSNSLPSKR